MKPINVLIIDDHPIIADAYKSAMLKISQREEAYHFNIKVANDIDTAIYELNNSNANKIFNIIFLDIKLPKSSDGLLLSGEDLGLEIRRITPKSKIIVATTYNDNYRLSNILKSINPDGFLIKNDISSDELVEAIATVIKNPPHYSKTILQLLRKQVTNDFILDKIDRQLLYELSIGTKMGDLPNVIPLSIGGLERRKRQLKEAFNVAKMDDKTLVETAKQKGFI